MGKVAPASHRPDPVGVDLVSTRRRRQPATRADTRSAPTTGRVLVSLACLLAACAQPAPEAETPAEPKLPVETRSRVDRAVATTGDVITYAVTVDHDSTYQVELPETGAEIAGFRIIDVGSEEPREENGRRILERWFKLRADLVGSYVLPPVEVAYRLRPADADQEPAVTQPVGEDAGEASGDSFETVRTSEIFIEVQSVLPEGGEVTDIRGLKPLRQVEIPTPWWWFAAGGGAVLLLTVLGILLWRRFHKPVVVPPRPAHEIAYEAPERLRQTDFADTEAMRRFHFEISEVIRGYVENRFTLNATDLTTEEIVEALGEVRGLGGADDQRLRLFLVATDQVKFAAYEPSEDEIAGTYEGALSFVEATRERPEVAPPDEVPPEGVRPDADETPEAVAA